MRLILAFGFLGVITAELMGKPAVLSLDVGLSRFMTDSPFLNQKRLNQDISEYEEKQVRSRLLPTLAITGNYRRVQKPDIDVRMETFSDVGVSISQPLFLGGKSIWEWKAAQASAKSARELFKQDVQNLKLQFIEAYFAVLSGQETVDLRQKLVSVLSDQLDVVKSRQIAGAAIASDVKQALARLAAARSELASAQSQLKSSLAILSKYLGYSVGERLQWPASLPAVDNSVAQLTKSVQEVNFRLKASKAQIEAQKARYHASKGGYMPSITAELSHLRRFDQGANELPSQQNQVLLSAKWELFSGLETFYQSQKAFALQEDSLLVKEILSRELNQSIAEALAQLDAAKQNLKSLKLAVDSAEEAARAFRVEYQNGLRDLSDVFSAEQDVLNANVSRIGAKYAFHIATYRILHLMGRL